MFSLELIWIGFNLVTVSPFFLSFFKKLFFFLASVFWCCYWLPIYLPRNWEAMFLYSNHRQFMDILLCQMLWCHCLIMSAAFWYILFNSSSDLEFDLGLTIGHRTTVLNILIIYKSSWMPWAAERLICTVLLTSYCS